MTTNSKHAPAALHHAVQRAADGSGTENAAASDCQSEALPSKTTDTTTTCDEADGACAQPVLKKALKSSGKGGAPANNRNREIHRGRAKVILGRAPAGCGHIYRQVREVVKALQAEWESKFGRMSVSQAEALYGAGHWLVRSRCLHKWARQPERTDTERNQALGDSAECHDRYISRLRSIGLAKPEGNNGNSDDPWKALDHRHANSDATNGNEDEHHAVESPNATGSELEAATGKGQIGK